eukprot:766157-Pelagomonas_calceolata.AAC.3
MRRLMNVLIPPMQQFKCSRITPRQFVVPLMYPIVAASATAMLLLHLFVLAYQSVLLLPKYQA